MRTVLICASLWLLSSCSEPLPDDPVVARVDDSVLTVAQLVNELPSGSSALEDDSRRQFVEHWVQQELLYQEALARDLDNTAGVRILIEQATRDLLVAALLDSEFENQEVETSEDAISTYYYNHQEDFQRSEDEIRIEHILLQKPRHVNTLRQDLLQGDSFADAAREHSLDRQSAQRGGDVGYFVIDDDPILWEACHNMPLDTISKPVKTVRGYYIIRVLARAGAGTVRELELVRGQIVEALVRNDYRRRLEELTDRLKSTTTWQIDEVALSTLGVSGDL